jgi:hypothetical protein
MKPAKTIPEQIEILRLRNLNFEDESKVRQFLLENNYYRLSGYWRKYQIDPDKGENNFINNITFEQIATIYELDALLINLLQKGIRIFEICFRSRIHSSARPLIKLWRTCSDTIKRDCYEVKVCLLYGSLGAQRTMFIFTTKFL